MTTVRAARPQFRKSRGCPTLWTYSSAGYSLDLRQMAIASDRCTAASIDSGCHPSLSAKEKHACEVKNCDVLALAFTLVGTIAIASRPARADDPSLQGNWKLVVLPFGEDEFAIVKVSDKEGKPTATVADAQQMLAANKVKTFERKDGTLTLVLTGANGDTSFKGKLAKEGAAPG